MLSSAGSFDKARSSSAESCNHVQVHHIYTDTNTHTNTHTHTHACMLLCRELDKDKSAVDRPVFLASSHCCRQALVAKLEINSIHVVLRKIQSSHLGYTLAVVGDASVTRLNTMSLCRGHTFGKSIVVYTACFSGVVYLHSWKGF